MCKNFNGKCILTGDLNAEESEAFFRNFSLKCTQKLSLKNLSIPSCIDLVINNSSSNFQNTKTISAA